MKIIRYLRNDYGTCLIFSAICILIALLVGCGIQLKKPVDPLCDTLADSWICEKSHEIGVQPENVYGWIYSAGALAAIKDTDNIDFLCKFEQGIADWYVSVYPVSYDKLIDEALRRSNLFEDPRQAILVKGIINKNLELYSSPDLIKPDDDFLLREGHKAFRYDFMCDLS